MRLMLANQATAAKRRVYFQLVDVTDGMTPETGEADGQPQISTDGGAWTDTGIGVLVAIGNGRYYAELTQSAVDTTGRVIETRYKSANTAEAVGDSVQVVAFDPDDAAGLGLSRIDDDITSRLAAADYTAPPAAAPTAAAVADAVWDEAMADHLAAGSTGEKLDAAGGSAGSTTATWTIQVTDGTDPVADATVEIRVAGGSTALQRGTTNTSGEVVFVEALGNHDVYVYQPSVGYWPVTTYDLEADHTSVIAGTLYAAPPPPPVTGMATAYAVLRDTSGSPVSGVTGTAKIVGSPSGSVIFPESDVSAESDGDGIISWTFPAECNIQVTIPAYDFTRTVTLPDSGSVNILATS